MSERCSYCNGGRLVGWSGAGPILCPSCSDGKDAFTVVTQAWREQRARALAAESAVKAAVEAEREACARECDLARETAGTEHARHWLRIVAATIRTRGET